MRKGKGAHNVGAGVIGEHSNLQTHADLNHQAEPQETIWMRLPPSHVIILHLHCIWMRVWAGAYRAPLRQVCACSPEMHKGKVCDLVVRILDDIVETACLACKGAYLLHQVVPG